MKWRVTSESGGKENILILKKLTILLIVFGGIDYKGGVGCGGKGPLFSGKKGAHKIAYLPGDSKGRRSEAPEGVSPNNVVPKKRCSSIKLTPKAGRSGEKAVRGLIEKKDTISAEAGLLPMCSQAKQEGGLRAVSPGKRTRKYFSYETGRRAYHRLSGGRKSV